MRLHWFLVLVNILHWFRFVFFFRFVCRTLNISPIYKYIYIYRLRCSRYTSMAKIVFFVWGGLEHFLTNLKTDRSRLSYMFMYKASKKGFVIQIELCIFSRSTCFGRLIDSFRTYKYYYKNVQALYKKSR